MTSEKFYKFELPWQHNYATRFVDTINKSKTNNCEHNLSPVILQSNQMGAIKLGNNFTRILSKLLEFPILCIDIIK